MIDLFESSCRKFYDVAAAQLALRFDQEAGNCPFAALQALIYQFLGLGNALGGSLQLAEHISSCFLIWLSIEANLDDLAPSFRKFCRQGGLRDFLFLIEYISVVHGSVQYVSVDAYGVIVVKLIVAKNIFALL